MPTEVKLIAYDYEAEEFKNVAIDPDTKAILVKEISPPPTDHGELTGLGDDDHVQYYNQARHTKAIHDTLGLLCKSGGVMTGLLTLSGAPTLNLHASTKKYVDDNVGAGNLSELTIDVNKDWNAKNIHNMGTISHKGATLKSGIQTEGRCSCYQRDADTAMPSGARSNNYCPFREKLTNTPSSITLSNVTGTYEWNISGLETLNISVVGFSFHIICAGGGSVAYSCDNKKYVTVGN